MSTDVTFDFTFPPCEPTTPPSFSFDPSLLEIPYNPGHARSSSHGSVYSFESSPSDSAATARARRTTPSRSPIRTHGPLLLPKIRSQDQAFTSAVPLPAPKRARTSPAPVRPHKSSFRPSHVRSHTNPETISFSAALSFSEDNNNPAPLLCSPVSFTHEPSSLHSRRTSTCSLDNVGLESYNFPSYQIPATFVTPRSSASPTPPPQPQVHLSQPEAFLFAPYAPRAPSPLAAAAPITPEAPMAPPTTLYSYLTSPTPALSLVRTLSFPLRDPNTRHFWWDVRQIRPWTSFSAASILSLPGASACLSMPVSSALLPNPVTTQRHPETESALHAIYAAHYLPKLNNALALCSPRPLKLSVPSKVRGGAAVSPHNLGMATDCMFVGNPAGEPASAAALFGGKPTARIVGLVKSFDRFNTGMRVEGNIKRVEYLRGLSHLHHAMREHGCRYGFILTEIELVFVRNGAESTPHFGYLEVGSVQLAASASSSDGVDATPAPADPEEAPLTACLALWGLCMLAAADEPMPGHAHWRAEIGAPAEGTRRKALPRDDWMPQPQLAEKREAKRSRGWIWPEDPISRREIGKRGVRYGTF